VKAIVVIRRYHSEPRSMSEMGILRKSAKGAGIDLFFLGGAGSLGQPRSEAGVLA
jgi:hypothetical protein